jgi:hypothetical protein
MVKSKKKRKRRKPKGMRRRRRMKKMMHLVLVQGARIWRDQRERREDKRWEN